MTELDKKPVILVVPSVPGPSTPSSTYSSSPKMATPMNAAAAGGSRMMTSMSGQTMHMAGGGGGGGGGGSAGLPPGMLSSQEMPTNLMVKPHAPAGQQSVHAGGRTLVHAPAKRGLNAAAVIQQLQQQRPSAPQSKYAELLAVIEDMGRDIRPTYAGSRTATERLRRGITHAKALVRECLAETERSART
ncbi:uncharacterized protein [Diadema antillarum]|uniref:uncharacterized protein n=1 Tax=Diadema antillarum TaxID=105358 RepID=UPI003A86DAE3